MQWVTLKVVIVSLLVMGIYTLFANSIPQIESRPPEELTLEEGEMNPEVLARLGEKIFYGKGSCAICHSIGSKGARAPDLADMGMVAAGRKQGVSATAYLFESLIDPGAHIVEGYGNIMPPVHKAPISLNESELMTMVAFLQSLGGTVTVTREDIPPEVRKAGAGSVASGVGVGAVPGVAEKGEELFRKHCTVCHIVKGVGGALGPDLSSIGARKEEGFIGESILIPGAVIAEGYPPVMPPDFSEQLTVKGFSDLMAYIMSLKGE